MALPSPLPDDPRKWDGWSRYNSTDPYERLCLEFENKPTAEEIEENTRQLLVWWQKKLPLKNQPSNPLAQMLRGGIDTAPRFIAEARVELLNPERRAQIDNLLFKRRRENALVEFRRFMDVALASKVLTAEAEAYLNRMGMALGLSTVDLHAAIEVALRASGAQRAANIPEPEPVAPPPAPAPAPEPVAEAAPAPEPEIEPAPEPEEVAAPVIAAPEIPRGRRPRNTPADVFRGFLEKSGVDEDTLSDDMRDMFIDYAENLGLNAGDAEDMVDDYLEAVATGTAVAKRPPSTTSIPASVPTAPLRSMAGKPAVPATRVSPVKAGSTNGPTIRGTVVRPSAVITNSIPHMTPQVAGKANLDVLSPAEERRRHSEFVNGVGMKMLFVPSATFPMGSNSPDAAGNEQPVGRVSISRYFISRFPVTNAMYEKFDAAHRSRRAPWADDSHPAIYVSALDAAKFCQWLSTRDRRRYRLPTEAEWEYAAKGDDCRTYPWGEETGLGNLANFADINTTFAWRDESVNDGYAETSPVGSYPRGASPFGVEDMAGNVWEWCFDFYAEYKSGDRVNPRGPVTGTQRVYRGGSWKSRFSNLRTTARAFNLPTYASNDVGFRIVCECD